MKYHMLLFEYCWGFFWQTKLDIIAIKTENTKRLTLIDCRIFTYRICQTSKNIQLIQKLQVYAKVLILCKQKQVAFKISPNEISSEDIVRWKMCLPISQNLNANDILLTYKSNTQAYKHLFHLYSI